MTKSEFEIELPEEETEAELVNPSTMGLFGLPKSGKTTAVLSLPGCLDVSVERKGVAFAKGTKLQIPDGLNPLEKGRWLKAAIKKIKAERKYKYVAYDTLTEIDMWCEWLGTERYMNSTAGKAFNRYNKTDQPNDSALWGKKLPFGHPDYQSVHELGNGYGYRYSRAEALDLFHEMADSGTICTIYVLHVADKQTVKIGTTDEVVTRNIALTGLVKDLVSRQLDAIAYLYNEDGKTMISFKGNEDRIGGMRGATHLRGYQGELDWSKIFI